jgi:sulfopyruvate decarboxylase TPP-binding subunit
MRFDVSVVDHSASAEGTLTEAISAEGISFFTGVADSGFKRLVSELESRELGRRYVLATREDNAVAIAAGAYLARQRPLVFMESSGFGNALDALTSLAIVYEIPMVLFIAWAGFEGRDAPHHNSIGEPLEAILRALKLDMVRVGLEDSPAAIARAVGAALRLAEAGCRPAVVLGVPSSLHREGDDE